MHAWLNPRVRNTVAAFAAAVYLFPAALGAIAELSHVAYHLHEAIQLQKQKAAAFGLLHVNEKHVAFAGDAHATHYVHTHGGAEHSHDQSLDALLAAAGHADSQVGSPSTAPMEISVHVPSGGTPEVLMRPLSRIASHRPDSAVSRPGPRPLLPPPRA